MNGFNTRVCILTDCDRIILRTICGITQSNTTISCCRVRTHGNGVCTKGTCTCTNSHGANTCGSHRSRLLGANGDTTVGRNGPVTNSHAAAAVSVAAITNCSSTVTRSNGTITNRSAAIACL
nr:hypothetical protein [Comamonas testosteroni]